MAKCPACKRYIGGQMQTYCSKNCEDVDIAFWSAYGRLAETIGKLNDALKGIGGVGAKKHDDPPSSPRLRIALPSENYI